MDNSIDKLMLTFFDEVITKKLKHTKDTYVEIWKLKGDEFFYTKKTDVEQSFLLKVLLSFTKNRMHWPALQDCRGTQTGNSKKVS